MQAVTAAGPVHPQGAAGASSTPASVALIASQPKLLRRMRASLKADGLHVCLSAATLIDASDQARNADAVVLAGDGGAGHAKELVRAAARRFPDVPLILVASLSMTGIRSALDAGAAGVVSDREVEAALAVTIRAVRAGQLVAPRALRRSMVRPVLSHRERQTLALVVRGLTNQQIAARLFLAESTVKTHLTSVFSKLGVASRSEAVALALEPDANLGLEFVGLPGNPTAPEPARRR